MQLWSILLLVFLGLLMGVGAWFFFIWSVKSGQYDDAEGPKYRMLDDDDEALHKGGVNKDKDGR